VQQGFMLAVAPHVEALFLEPFTTSYLCTALVGKVVSSGANPTIVSYIASVVKIYNATNGTSRF
jgi:hypothetical protein